MENNNDAQMAISPLLVRFFIPGSNPDSPNSHMDVGFTGLDTDMIPDPQETARIIYSLTSQTFGGADLSKCAMFFSKTERLPGGIPVVNCTVEEKKDRGDVNPDAK